MKNFDDYMVLRGNLLKNNITVLLFFIEGAEMVVNVLDSFRFHHEMLEFVDVLFCGDENGFFNFFDRNAFKGSCIASYNNGLSFNIWFI